MGRQRASARCTSWSSGLPFIHYIFSRGSTVEANGAPGFGPATGAWAFVRSGEFVATYWKPIYNAITGALIGTLKIKSRIQMKSVDEYEAHGSLVFYLPNGVTAASWTTVVNGERIKPEPVD